ncbi:hypothetical protein ABPG74_001381 [Tetrahymena malaccensis]
MQITEEQFFEQLYLKLIQLAKIKQREEQLNRNGDSQQQEPFVEDDLISEYNHLIEIPLNQQGKIQTKSDLVRISISDFEIFATLGTGTFGRVRQVKLKGDTNKEIFALKMLKKTEIVRLNQVEHINSEKKILQSVKHPFIVQMYPPFYDNEPIGIYKKIIAGIIEFPRFFDNKAKDLIRKLLNPDLNYRLGVHDKGQSVSKHKWFRGVDWESVFNKDIPAPWTPQLRNEQDASCFEKYPDSQEGARSLPRDLQHLFEDF